jgi:hypothetical protein
MFGWDLNRAGVKSPFFIFLPVSRRTHKMTQTGPGLARPLQYNNRLTAACQN